MKFLSFLTLLLTFSLAVPEAEEKAGVKENITAAALTVTIPEGWKTEEAPASSTDIVLRLAKEMPLAGAPRIDFYVQPKAGGKPTLKSFINKNLQALASQEKSRQIRITYRDQRNTSFNQIYALRLRYDYNLLAVKGSSISQVNYFFDRGDCLVMISAFGVSELYLPLSDEIEDIIQSIVPFHPNQHDAQQLTAKRFFTPQKLAAPDMITSASQPAKSNQHSTFRQVESSNIQREQK